MPIDQIVLTNIFTEMFPEGFKPPQTGMVFITFGWAILLLISWIALQWTRLLEARLRRAEVIERYEILKATNDSRSTTIGTMLSNLLQEINDTNELLNQIPSSSKEGKQLYERLLVEQQKIQSPEIHSLIIRAVNDSNDGIVDLFTANFPDLADRHTATFALCAGKVAPKIASLILDLKPKSFYMRRDRLRDAVSRDQSVDPAIRARLLPFLSSPRTDSESILETIESC